MLCIRVLAPLALLVPLFAVGWFALAAPAAADSTTDKAKQFLTAHETRFKPLEIAASVAWWEANTTGDDAAYKKKEEAQNKMDAVLADPAAFKELKALREQREDITDPVVGRAIDVLYLMYLEKQLDPELLKKIVARENAVEKAFTNFRAKVEGKEMPDSEVRKALKDSKSSEKRQAVWEASKEVGKVLEADLRELVKLRNEAAVKLGFKNFHQLKLFLNEQNTTDLMKLFDELDALTREPFAAAKAEIDAKLAADCGIKVADLRPWHYHDPFFQESPAVFAADLDAPYRSADILQLCREFYTGIGLPIDDVLARSDLKERKGKNPHAFCTDINRAGDVRVLANVVQNEYWMGTMLHELGHAVYSSKNIPPTLPYTLRTDAHILCTEGVAMLFERFSKSQRWLTKMGVEVKDPNFEAAAAKVRRNQLLIFSRWCQVMLRFEKSMYENPGQDLNKLWWDLVEKYQMIQRPAGRNAPDFASKIHIVSAPVYYHNYMMGELFACQVHHTIVREVLKEEDPDKALYNGNKDVGQFMRKKVFEPGRLLPWNELTKFATGKELEAKAFAQDFRGK